MDKYLIVAHGLPGTGKSTYTQNLQTSICSDFFQGQKQEESYDTRDILKKVLQK